jgi:hypothetical protein
MFFLNFYGTEMNYTQAENNPRLNATNQTGHAASRARLVADNFIFIT